MFSDGDKLSVLRKVNERMLASSVIAPTRWFRWQDEKKSVREPHLLIISEVLQQSVNYVSQCLQSWVNFFCLSWMKKFHWSQEEKDANFDLIFLVKDSWAKLLAPKMEGSPLETPRERSWQVFRIILNVVSTTKPEIDQQSLRLSSMDQKLFWFLC